MRRILSILLLLVLGLGPAVPAGALASGWSGKVDGSVLPACCRRNGKHHCAMGGESSQLAASHGETTVAAQDSCPFAPRALASTAPSFAALLNVTASSTIRISERCAMRGIEAAARISDRRNQPKRGPPATQIL